MNKKLIETARDADLRLSQQALRRAAQRARELAAQTGTVIIVSRNGVIEQMSPTTESHVQEPAAPYGDKR